MEDSYKRDARWWRRAFQGLPEMIDRVIEASDVSERFHW
jgi:hypothetical protein